MKDMRNLGSLLRESKRIMSWHSDHGSKDNDPKGKKSAGIRRIMR